MDEIELADRFVRQRPQMRAVAYRILGSLSEADDAVQDAWLRLRRTEAEQLDLERWLTTVVARICLNMLRSRLGPAASACSASSSALPRKRSWRLARLGAR